MPAPITSDASDWSAQVRARIDSWQSVEIPGLTPAQALGRVRGFPQVGLLHDGAGMAVLAWSQPRPAEHVCDRLNGPVRGWLAELDPGHVLGRSWSTDLVGGSLVQFAYEGADVGPLQPQAQLSLDGFLCWTDGGCRACGIDAANLARVLAIRGLRDRTPALPRLTGDPVPAWDGPTHATKVEALRDHIARGDCYQVNLTVPFAGTLAAGDDIDVFLALAAASPAPFAGFFRVPGRPSVVSHSPECFLSWRGDRIVSCPIKGTRKRSGDPAVRDELLVSEKDRAELAMIVDLVRNDLGRIAVPGSVRVTEPARLMDLPYVHHLVADIAARARPGTTVADLLAAAFPAGSITGAPKRMAMDLIRRYEAGPRGAYCGAFGWLGPTGGELAVAIRTLTVDGSRVTLHAGSGITADSVGHEEWDEVRAKASAMAGALGGRV